MFGQDSLSQKTTSIGKFSKPLCFKITTSIHGTSINKCSDGINLLPRSKGLVEHRGASRIANSTASGESQTGSVLNSGVAPGHGYGETWILVLARLIAVPPITEAGIADGLGGQAHVVVEELSPLHQHVGAVFIHGHMVSRHQEGGDQARTWKMVTIVHSRGIPTCQLK